MQLIGMLDSPYVRRVAIALHYASIPFDHNPLSVFRNIDEFTQINPLVKAPTLVCDDGEVLMDSTLILAYIQQLGKGQPCLMPSKLTDYQRALRLIGLGLNACDKSVQIVYERELRPAEKQHQPWRDRIQTQLFAAYDLLELYAAARDGWFVGKSMSDADITVAVAWQFTQHYLEDVVDRQRYPALTAFSAYAEASPAFLAVPIEDGWKPKL
ncbi:MAG: glutathione S-transferase N-terminal domain-containing protein [Cyanobacteria bacterium J06649_4]